MWYERGSMARQANNYNSVKVDSPQALDWGMKIVEAVRGLASVRYFRSLILTW
jgi:hypothetical protein